MEAQYVPPHAISLSERPYYGDIRIFGASRRYISTEDQNGRRTAKSPAVWLISQKDWGLR